MSLANGCFGVNQEIVDKGLQNTHYTEMSVFHQVVRQSDSDQVTVIGAGVTLHEALAAADTLAKEGRPIMPSSG